MILEFDRQVNQTILTTVLLGIDSRITMNTNGNHITIIFPDGLTVQQKQAIRDAVQNHVFKTEDERKAERRAQLRQSWATANAAGKMQIVGRLLDLED